MRSVERRRVFLYAFFFLGFEGPTASGSEVEHWEEEVVEVSVVLRSRHRPSPPPSSAMAVLVEGEPSWDFWGLESLAGFEPKKPNQEVLKFISFYISAIKVAD